MNHKMYLILESKGVKIVLQHSELVKNSSFWVYIGNRKISFAKVSGIGGSIEREVYAEGGSINSPHVMKNAKSQLGSIRFERGIQSGNGTLKKLNPGTFIPGIQIIVMGADGKPYYEYFVKQAWVVKWEVGELDAISGSSVLVDTLEIEFVEIEKEILR